MLQGLAALLGQMDSVFAAVAGMGPALGEAELFELIDDRDHRAGIDHRAITQLLLGAAWPEVDQGEHPKVVWAQAEGLKGRREEMGDPLSIPGEQEAGRAGEGLWRGLVKAHTGGILRSSDHLCYKRL